MAVRVNRHFSVVWFYQASARIGLFNSDKLQDNSFTPDEALNSLIYGSPFCVIIYTSYKTFPRGPDFCDHPGIKRGLDIEITGPLMLHNSVLPCGS